MSIAFLRLDSICHMININSSNDLKLQITRRPDLLCNLREKSFDYFFCINCSARIRICFGGKQLTATIDQLWSKLQTSFSLLLYLYHCLARRCSSARAIRCNPCHPSHRNTCTPTGQCCWLCTVRARNRNSGNLPSCSVFRSNPSRTSRYHSCIGRVRCIVDRIVLDCTIRRTSQVNSHRRCQRNDRGGRSPSRIILKVDEGNCEFYYWVVSTLQVSTRKQHRNNGKTMALGSIK